VLASRSPQRRAILEQLGVDFEVVPAAVEEVAHGDPEAAARENAARKARAVAAQRGDALVLGADTIVALGERILDKPADPERAREWLRALSGRTHRVIGGLCLVGDGGERAAVAVTEVEFRELGADEVEWYLASGEWRERAGGYAIQGRGGALVRGIRGDYLNVVGLPVPALLDLVPDLLEAGGP
jgi:septum formation protein